MTEQIKIGVLGAGTWGIALARMLAEAENSVTVWSALGEEIDYISANRRHPNLLDALLPERIIYTKEISEVPHHVHYFV